MSAMVYNLIATGNEISLGEQVLNVIKAFPSKPEHWKSFKLLTDCTEHVKTFSWISKHLEMKEERLKALNHFNVVLVFKVRTPW